MSFADLSARIRRRLRAAVTRTRFRLGLPTLDAGRVRMSPGFRHPVEAMARPNLVACYRELFPSAVQSEAAAARRLMEHRFELLGHEMTYGEKIDWSRDPVSGRDWSSGFSPQIPYRGVQRLGDIKLPWELNKHQHFFTLGKTAWLTADAAYAREVVRQIDDWIAENPPHRGIHWVSALESGTRVISWILAYPFFRDHCDEAFRARMLRSLAQHLLFVERNLSVARFANTHLAGEAAVLAIGGLFLDCRHSRRWLESGLRHLNEQIVRQVRADGAHAEQSMAYHRFFLDQYYLVDAMLLANGRSFPAQTLEAMERMTAYLMDMLFPDGTAPAFGDGDDARGLWLRADCPRDYRSLLALGAVRFGRADFKYTAHGYAEEVLWMHGRSGIDRFQALPNAVPDHLSVAYPDAGYYALRGGWENSAPLLVFDCGPLGHGPAGHGHADALSFQLYAQGYHFLVDSGTYSYNLDYSWRDAFRSTRAHNTVVVDGLDQSVMQDRMSWKDQARARCNRWLVTPQFDLVDAEHDGYGRLADPVRHRRHVIFHKPDTWLICDELAGGDAGHSLEWLLHLRPDCRVEQGAQAGDLTLVSPQGAKLKVWFFGLESGLEPQILAGGETERGAWFSEEYGVRTPSLAIRVQCGFEGRRTLMTCLSISETMTRERAESLLHHSMTTLVGGAGTATPPENMAPIPMVPEDSMRALPR